MLYSKKHKNKTRGFLYPIKNDYNFKCHNCGVSKTLTNFLKDQDLITIPALAEEFWRLEMIDGRSQRYFPFAYYSGQKMGVAFATSEMDHSSKLQSMKGNNMHFSRNVTPHELIPGHHLQSFIASRNNTETVDHTLY